MELLRKLYYDPSTGFQSSKLYTRAKAIDTTITAKQVRAFLRDQPTEEVYKRRAIKHFYPLIARAPGRIQVDLMDMSNELSQSNSGMKWMYVAVDVYSRYAFTYPQRSKSVRDCVASLIHLQRDSATLGFQIYQIDSDNEAAFMSGPYKSVCTAHNIHQNFADVGSKHATGIVERMNLTIRTMYGKYKLATGRHDWVRILPSLTENYNTTRHSTSHVVLTSMDCCDLMILS